jgi:MoaA/NifB/PqqE/SkfB family radical SAM enzyme
MIGPTGDDYRVVQVHPTTRCNLRCHHCYSSSGPQSKDVLPVALLEAALQHSARLGYNAVGISGGEPLLYDELDTLLGAARAAGLVTTVTTNGTLLDDGRVRDLAPLVDFFAVSIDGDTESHNRVRASRRAYQAMREGLDVLRMAGCRFGLIFTLTLGNLDELSGVVEFAAGAGAALVQVHPLEEAGRASSDMQGAAPDDLELAYACLEVVRLRRRFGERPLVHLDVASRPVLAADPARGFAGKVADDSSIESLSPLVIEADGTVVPLQYGFGRRYALGNIVDEPLVPMLARWQREGRADFLELCRRVYREQVSVESPSPFFNWYGAMREASLVASTPVASPVRHA